MGLFSRNTLDPTDKSRLAGYCALMMVLCHHYEGYWPDDDRYRYMQHWLTKAKHRTPVPTQTKLAAIADTVARRFFEEQPEELARLIDTKDEVLSEHLMSACREEMEARDLA